MFQLTKGLTVKNSFGPFWDHVAAGKNSGEAVRAPIPLIFDFLQRSTHAATGKIVSSGIGARDTLQNCVVRKSVQNFQGFRYHLRSEISLLFFRMLRISEFRQHMADPAKPPLLLGPDHWSMRCWEMTPKSIPGKANRWFSCVIKNYDFRDRKYRLMKKYDCWEAFYLLKFNSKSSQA